MDRAIRQRWNIVRLLPCGSYDHCTNKQRFTILYKNVFWQVETDSNRATRRQIERGTNY